MGEGEVERERYPLALMVLHDIGLWYFRVAVHSFSLARLISYVTFITQLNSYIVISDILAR